MMRPLARLWLILMALVALVALNELTKLALPALRACDLQRCSADIEPQLA